LKNRKRRGLLGLVLMATMGLLASSADPARANAESGAGTGQGRTIAGAHEEDPPLVPPCIEVPLGHTFEFLNDGTYTATDLAQTTNPTATYDGPTTATVTTDRYWFNPEGTFGETGTAADGTCTVPAPVPVDVVISERGTNAGTVSCSGSGVYSRVSEAFAVTFDAKCTVTDSTGGFVRTSGPGTPTHTIEGGQHPCFPDGPTPVDPCAIVPEFFPVTYTETAGASDAISPTPPPDDPQDGCPTPTIVEGPMGPEVAPDECTDSAGFADDIDESQSLLQSPPEPSSAQDMWGPSTDTMSTTLIDQGFENGGCTANGTCDDLEVFWNRSKGFQRRTAKGLRLYHGLQINTWLKPPEEGIAPGWYYDFLVQETSVTNDYGRVCVVRNAVKNPEGNPNVLSKWPGTVHQSVTNGDTKTLSIGASLNAGAGTLNASYSTTFPVATGKIYGDYDFTKSAFFGVWRVPNLASKCDKSGGQQIASGIAYAYNTPAPPHRRYTFGGLVASQAIKGDPAMRSQAIPVVEHEDG
jgi:hypothetical protein